MSNPSFATTDLSDAHGDAVRISDPIWRDFGGNDEFHGQVKIIKLFEDNSLVRAQLEQPGEDRVLVVDGGGSLRCALLGDQLGDLAVANHWAGVVVFGCVRDSVALGRLPIGIKALTTHPRKSRKRGLGEEDLPVTFGGITIRPGEWVYADADGLIVSDTELQAV